MIRKTAVVVMLTTCSAVGVVVGAGSAYLLTLKLDARSASRRRSRSLVMKGVVQ